MTVEYGTITTIEGIHTCAPTKERRAALAAQRAKLVSANTKAGKSRYDK